jgi:hypothetical protein
LLIRATETRVLRTLDMGAIKPTAIQASRRIRTTRSLPGH